MRFASVRLQNFRNLPLAVVELAGKRTFLVGANAQGKTNFLEAAGYVTALRSFRGSEPRALIALDQREAGMAFVLEHERFGESRLRVALAPDGRDVWWEEKKITRLAEVLGRFPTVVFSSQDNQLLRGSPALRRRWLDLTLAAMDAGYLAALQGYTRAVAERNVLLKRGAYDAAQLGAFESEAAGHGVVLGHKRARGVEELAGLFRAAHARLMPGDGAGTETAGLVYAPDTSAVTREEHAALLAKCRPRDALLKSTERGPHRDDVEFLLNGRPARQYASEGQQRCLVLALRLAQAAYFQAQGGVTPVLLCDDVLGELDPVRRERFWAALERDPQVIATGTVPPADGQEWQVLRVEGGNVLETE